MERGSTECRVLIIGGGFSGLAVAIGLLKRGIRDFVIVEKASVLGGTWRENTYPGCACDVPSHLYSYSFARKANWSRVFAEQPEIQAYLLDIAQRYSIIPHVHFETDALKSAWDEDRARWIVDTNRGRYVAQFVVLGQGPLHERKIPNLPGLDTFSGTTFHSAAWRHDHDLRGRRVAVIGTGSSAIQFVPKIQPEAEKLVVFQRTAPWVLPKLDYAISPTQQWALKNVPGLQRTIRGAIYGLTETVQLAQRNALMMQQLQRIGLRHLRRQVADPVLRLALTPDFTLGCKRILLSNTWYPALQAPNTELVSHGVERITERGVVAADGVEQAVDTIIFGTGFFVTNTSMWKRVIGRGNNSLDDVWQGSPQAYVGTTCHGFPNLFFMIGPNTGNGHGSAMIIIEAQAKYTVDAIDRARRDAIASFEVRAGAQEAWNDEVQSALKKSVWNSGGCSSYYLDQNGRNSTIYPWTTIDLRRRLRRFNETPYGLRHEAALSKPEATPSKRRSGPSSIAVSGAVVAITGGARGIGLATGRLFIEKGAVVCIGDLNMDAARRAQESLGSRAHAFHLDVTQRSSFEQFISDIERDIGPIDVLINNAGVMPTGRFLDGTDEADRATMSVNHFGPALGMKLVLPLMIARGRGHVVNVASLAGKIEVPFLASYVASKHAIVGLTGAVRSEIDKTGVTLTVVMPGAVHTDLNAGIPMNGLYPREPSEVALEIVDSVRTRRPDVVVPRVLAPVVPLTALAPRVVLRAMHGILHADRLIEPPVQNARTSYLRTIHRQGTTKESARNVEDRTTDLSS